MKFIIRGIGVVLVSVLLMLVVACGSDNDDKAGAKKVGGVRSPGTGSELKLPRAIVNGKSNVQNVSAQSTLYSSSNLQAAAATDPGTDYTTDPVMVSYMLGDSTAMEFVNVMLCMIDELQATSKVNQGVFVGHVPYNICSKSNVGLTNSNVQVELLVNSTRADDNSPQYIQIWMNDPWSDTPQKDVVEFIVYKSVSIEDPFGIFDVNYADYIAASYTAPVSDWMPVSRASIRSKKSLDLLPRFEFMLSVNSVMQGVNVKFNISDVTELTSADLKNGQSHSQFQDFSQVAFASDVYSIFDDNYNLEMIKIIGDTCFAKNSINTMIVAYNLYDAASGQRIPIQTGAPIELTYNYQGTDYVLTYVGPGLLFVQSINVSIYDITIPDGTILSDVNGNSYIVKAVAIDYTPAIVDISLCSGLDRTAPENNTHLNLKDLAPIQAPTNSLSDWPVL